MRRCGADRAGDTEFCPFHTALTRRIETAKADGQPSAVMARLHCRGDRYLDLHVTPVQDAGKGVPLLVAVGRDVTAEVRQQQQLDALHQAGRELTAPRPSSSPT